MTPPLVICVGNGVLDQVYEVDAMPAAGVKTSARGFRESGGGPGATAALAIARLGGHAAWWGRVGDDAAGRYLQDELARGGVDLSGLHVLPEARTVRATVIVDGAGERSILAYRAGMPMGADVLAGQDPARAAIMLADTRWPEGAEVALQRAAALGIPRVLDADGGEASTVERLAALCGHVVFSNEGLADFAGEGRAEDRLARTAARLSGVVAVTLGPHGSLWATDGTTTLVPAFPVEVRDTTGCGDVFHGAYALGLAEGMAPLAAARFASGAAALKARNGQGWDGMPDRADVDAILTGNPR